MECKVISSIKEKNIPIKVTASYIFVGPKNRLGKSCFNCFYNSLRDNESYLYGILKNCTDEDMTENLNDFEWERLENLDYDLNMKVALISRKDYSVEYLPVHCHPLVKCDEVKSLKQSQDIDWSYIMDANKRVKDGQEMFAGKNNERLIKAHSGIGKSIVRDADSMIIPMFYVKSNVLTSRYYSYGRSMTYQDSKMSAEFEMLERYASIVPRTKADLTGSYNELTVAGYSLISPRELSMNQIDDEVKRRYGFDYYSDDNNYRWSKVMRLSDTKDFYVPEQVLYYDAQLVSGEKRFMYETSNGCAMGGTFEEAVVYGLLELVERDAFLMHWYNKVAPVQLDISRIRNNYLIDVIKYMTCIGYELRVMDITMETGIPAIWVAAIDRTYKGRMKCYNAAGAHINPEKALEAALVEVATSIGIYDKIIRNGTKDELLARLSNNPDAVENMEDHVYFYSLDENYKYIEPYYSNGEKVDFVRRFKDWYGQKNHSFTLREFIERFEPYHKDIYIGLMESKANQELGLWCIKAIVPSMLAMTFGVRNQRINLERIRKGAVIAGIRSSEIEFSDINVAPHPFP